MGLIGKRVYQTPICKFIKIESKNLITTSNNSPTEEANGESWTGVY